MRTLTSKGWFSPLDRREIGLILFCITVFTLAYNLEASFQYLGLSGGNTHAVLGHFGLSRFKTIENDGRKLPAYRDQLENKIYGAWAWTAGFVAGDSARRGQELGGQHDAMWLPQDQVGELTSKAFGQERVGEGFRRWGTHFPSTKIVRHMPGYTILDNVIIMNGSVYVVTDDRTAFPALATISSQRSDYNNWQFISKEEAPTKIGPYGGVVQGVTWMSPDFEPHNVTLLSLWRLYSSLDPDIDSTGATSLPPPRRLIFPSVRFFTDANPDFAEHWIRRRRVDTGFHPFFAKAALPYMTELYFEDWEDYHQMEVPFIFDRLVIADRQSASASVQSHQPVFSPPFEVTASRHWLAPIQCALSAYFEVKESTSAKVVTYIHRQGRPGGLRIKPEHHKDLMNALTKLQHDRGYVIQIVSSLDEETSWNDRMHAIVRSTIILGVSSDDLFDAFYMKPSAKATLMEFFPAGSFSHDRQLIAQSMDLNYIAWWPDRKFKSDELPPAASAAEQDVSINVSAVVASITDILSH